MSYRLKLVMLTTFGMSMLVSCSKYSNKDFEGEWGRIISEKMYVHDNRVYTATITEYLEFEGDNITETHQATIDDEIIFSYDISGRWKYDEDDPIFRLFGDTKCWISIDWDLDSFTYYGDGESFDINYDEILNEYAEWNEENAKNNERKARLKNIERKHHVSIRTVHGLLVTEVNEEHLIFEGTDDQLIEYDKL